MKDCCAVVCTTAERKQSLKCCLESGKVTTPNLTYACLSVEIFCSGQPVRISVILQCSAPRDPFADLKLDLWPRVSLHI